MVSTSPGKTLPTYPGAAETMRAPMRWAVGLAALLIVLAAWAVYSDSFGGAFAFDDLTAILKNPSIQKDWREALSPPIGTATVSGRPLVNLSLALNYHLGGFNVWGYHAVNLLIQMLAGLTLFGFVRQTLERPVLRRRYGAASLPLAFVIALLWVVHPLQTESVTYIVQRAESLMGLFYLLTLYFFVLGVESPRAWPWYALSASACLLGMFTKETMVTAPVMVLLYDRTFVAGTFAGAWRQRWKFYAVLAGAWVPLAWLVATVSWPANAGQINPGFLGLSPVMKSFVYGLKQCEAIGRYLALSFWPHPLVLNYGNEVVTNPMDVAPQIMALAILLGATIYALWKKPTVGFWSAWFFVILVPTSSIVPLTGQTMAEHHMYLSLAAILVLVVLGLYALLGRYYFVAGLILAAGLGSLTFERNHDYGMRMSIWFTVLQSRPNDARAHNDLGVVLQQSGRINEAVARYETALAIRPDTAEYYYNLGTAYDQENNFEPACDAYLKAIQLHPDFADAQTNLGSLYLKANRVADAIPLFSTAIQNQPDSGKAHLGLANALLMNNQAGDAASQFETALQLMPESAGAHANFAIALVKLNRFSDAARQFEETLSLDPNYPNARNSLDKIRPLAQTPPNGVKP